MANESYEDFARALQTEYEEDCGVTFGKVPLTALARITRGPVDGQEVPIGKDAAEAIRAALVGQKMLEADGRLGVAFDPRKKDFKLELPPEYSDLQPSIIDLLAAYREPRSSASAPFHFVSRPKCPASRGATLSPFHRPR